MSGIKLYGVSDGPPSLACRQALKALGVDFTLVPVNFNIGEHLTPEYEKLNPQKEIPVLDDNGFLLSESNAIIQYLADKYAKDDKLYPKDPKARAIVNHRLCFNLASYYKNIATHALAPIFYKVERTDFSLKMVHVSLKVFNEYFQRTGYKYAAADHLTIADFPLITATMSLEAIKFDISGYPLVEKWYSTFKQENPDLWAIAAEGMKELHDFEFVQPPDLSKLDHPLFPVRK